jgi:hypothetical protein
MNLPYFPSTLILLPKSRTMGPIIDPKEILLLVAGTLLTIITAILVIWPFAGTLIRLWANHVPRHIALGDEGEGGNTRPLITDDSRNHNWYWSLFLRVKRVEVISGIFLFQVLN